MLEYDVLSLTGLHNEATPLVDYNTGRNVRMFALHPRYAEQGAVFNEFMGCEATFWFDTRSSTLKPLGNVASCVAWQQVVC